MLLNSKKNLSFRNFVINSIEAALEKSGPRPRIICADSGAHLIFPELLADYLIGDFDSIEPEILAKLIKKGIDVIKHPREKDFTDFHLALDFALSLKPGPSEIIVFGGLSGRLDQTLANIYTSACFSAGHDVKISLHENKTSVYLLNAHFKKLELNEGIRPGDTVSLRPLFKEAVVRSVRGLKYRLAGEKLRAIETRGVSNEATSKKISVAISSGELIVVHLKGSGRRG